MMYAAFDTLKIMGYWSRIFFETLKVGCYNSFPSSFSYSFKPLFFISYLFDLDGVWLGDFNYHRC